MARSRTILVAGAGIGGLAAGIALARTGLRTVLLERTERLEEIGAGIQLTPNATRALDRLGALELVRERAVEARELVVGCGETGRLLARAPLADAVARFGSPWLLTHRADLQRALYRAATDNVDVVLELNTEVLDFATHPRGVTALVSRASRRDERLGIGLIGADGLWSKVRGRLHPESALRFHRLVAWRALVPAGRLPRGLSAPTIHLWLGAGAHVVHYPVAGGELINVVAVFRDDWEAAGWNAPGRMADLPDACDNWSEIPQRVIAAAREFRRCALADRDPLRRWGEGRVSLLGDAAHPMLPFLAQGAAAALEDAVSLARHVQHWPELPDALRAYESERAGRAARLQRGARFTARAYHWRGPLRWARDLKLRWDAEKLVDRHAWIYRYQPA